MPRGYRHRQLRMSPQYLTAGDGDASVEVDAQSGGGLLGGLGAAGGIGIFSLVAALFSRGNATETMLLLLYGIMIETGRRVFNWLSKRVLVKPSITAMFREGDPAFEWIMLYLTQENVWKKSRVFEVSAKSTTRKWHINASSYFPSSVPGALNADYVPNWSTPHMFSYRGYWVDVVKSGQDMGGGSPMRGMNYGYSVGGGANIRLTFFTGWRIKMTVLSDFVEECRMRYLDSNRPRVIIHLSDSGMMGPAGEWGNVKTKTRRPLHTLALESGVMDTLIEDVREFLDVEDWYTEAGIPHHRGYLLHGPPGTGKTSTIYALAGELGLEIYSLSLASGYLDDAYLQRLATAVPRGSILLVEDIDCAFPSREDEEDAGGADPRRRGPNIVGGTFMPPGGYRPPTGVTLSGLLNVIDGVGSDEGRLFFATTNHYDRLDPALVRPGRIDVKLEYKKAGKPQALALFNRFFSPSRFEATDTPSADPSTQTADTSGLRHRRGASGDAPKAKQALSAPLSELGQRFMDAIPAGEFSAAEIQGFLLDCKWNPDTAAAGVAGWVAKERADRAAQREREEARKQRQREKMLDTQGIPGFASYATAMLAPADGVDAALPNGHGLDQGHGGGRRGGRGRGRGSRSGRPAAAGADDPPHPVGEGGENGDSVVESDETISTESDFTDVGGPSPTSGASPPKSESSEGH